MLNLLLNKIQRVKTKKVTFVMAVIVMPLMIALAIFFANKSTTVYTVAFISNESTFISDEPSIQVETMKTKPKDSELVLGKYTAIVETNADATYTVKTYKNKEVKNKIESFFTSGIMKDNETESLRGMGTSILGFVFMIILMQGVSLTTFYPEDRNNSIFKRILTSPVSSGKYLMTQGIFTFICLYIPTYLAIVITSSLLNVDIHFSFGTLAILMAIMTTLTTAFSLFMASVTNRNIGLATSGIAIVTCILAGCLFNFSGNSGILNVICNIIPQTAFMTLAQGIENGIFYSAYISQLLYILAWSLGLCFIGIVVTKSRLRKGIC